MREVRIVVACLVILIAVSLAERSRASEEQAQQVQQGQQAQQGQRGAPPPAGAPAPAGQRGGGRGRAQVMSLTTTGWTDGGVIPIKYSQAGAEVSPPLAWKDAPENTASFVLIAHDLDAAGSNGVDDLLQWMVWNIPGTATSLPEGVSQGPQLPDGMRQISVSGPYYRGPGAPATGPVHHYLFELFALDTTIDVAPASASVAETRAAVLAAMAGHVRGKGVLTGLFKWPAAPAR